MKRKLNLVVAILSGVLLVITGCSKGTDTASGAGTSSGGGGTITATLTVQPPPTFPLWNGDSYSFSYSSTNTTGVKINGLTYASSGTISLTGMTKDSTLLFETVVTPGTIIASPKSITVPVFKPVRTMVCKDVLYWKNVWFAAFLTTDNMWHYFPAGCAGLRPNRKYYPTGDTCKFYHQLCGPIPNTTPYFNLDNSENYLYAANLTMKILKLTNDSLILESADGIEREGWAAFR